MKSRLSSLLIAVPIALLTSILGDTTPETASLEAALARAGGNRSQLEKALTDTPEEQREGMRFLITHMPAPDLKTLTADYLLENARWAYEARTKVPWGKTLADELFFNDVLPYASINERRDNWRRDFFERCMPLIKDCKTPGEAAQALNKDLFKMIDVQYHASKRPKPDQSPYESIEAKYASCSGLSVLLIDACRAVCVPARFVGTPQWTTKRGNHSWVEVWDQDWHFTGACEYNPNGLDQVWFLGDASKAVKEERRHAIYASSWKQDGLNFPLIWDRDNTSVSAVNVTDRYTGAVPKRELKPGEVMLAVEVFEEKGGERVARHVSILLDGRNIKNGNTTSAQDDKNHLFEWIGNTGQTYTVRYTDSAEKEVDQTYTATGDARQTIRVFLK